MSKSWEMMTENEKFDELKKALAGIQSQIEIMSKAHDALAKEFQRVARTVHEFERSFDELKRDSRLQP
jgi:hypothetical protein